MSKILSNHIDELDLVIEFNDTKNKKNSKINGVLKGFYILFVYLILILFLVFAILPFYWMINTSLKSMDEITNEFPPTFFPTYGVYFSNYIDVFSYFDFTRYLLNTLIVIVFSTIGTLILTILAAFAFAKLEFKGRDTLFTLCLVTMMIPSELFVITNFITVYRFGLLNYTGETVLDASRTYLAIMLPFLVNVFFIYLLRQNFKQIPNELQLACKVDGRNDFAFLWKIVVPMCSPTIITTIILKIISTWNAYAWPNLINRGNYALISVALSNAQFTDMGGRNLVNLEMAAAFLVTLPLIILFIIFRKYIMKGTSKAGIKG